MGTYYLQIQACVDVDNGASAPICSYSNEFTVQIQDPCTATTIASAPITTFMRQPILQPAYITMPMEQGASWPWRDNVDAAISDTLYGTGLCGPIEYYVLTQDDLETDLVTFDPVDQKLNFNPLLKHMTQIYYLKLKARMVRYPWITTSQNFNVEVLPCQTTIYSTNVSIPNVSNTWYSGPDSLAINQYLTNYYQFPNCEYNMDFNVYRLVSDSQGSALVPLPLEVDY